MQNSLQLLSTKSTAYYTQKVFDELCLFPEFYSNHYHQPYCIDIKNFADGEIEANIGITLRGKDVVFFVSSGRSFYEEDPAKAKMILYHCIDAIKRSQPRRLIVFEPYCSPARSDRSMGRNSVGIWLHYRFLENLGVNVLFTYQLHSAKSTSIIDPSVSIIEDVPASLQIMEYIASHHIRTIDYFDNYVKDNWLFCSVDAGGEGFARKFAEAFHTGLITSYKQRNYTQINTIESINILTATDLTDKEIWVVDDMIDTGASMEKLIRKLGEYNVKKIHVAIIHPVFSRPSLEKMMRLYEQGLLHTLLVLDTIPHEPEYHTKFPFMKVVSSEKLSAQLVMSIHEDKSLAPFFEAFNINNFLLQLPYRQ